MKKIKILICVCLIIIFLLLISIILVNNKDADNNQKQNNEYIDNTIIDLGVSEEEVNMELEKDNVLKYVSDRNYYSIVQAIINNYVSAAIYGQTDVLMNIISDNYIKEYNVTEKNILNKIGIENIINNKIYATNIINDMLEAKQDNYNIYLIKGKYRLSNSTKYENLNLMIVINDGDLVYEIYPDEYVENNNYTKLNVGNKINLQNIIIDSERAQKFTYTTLTDQELANELFNDWNEKIVYDREIAYNKLNSEYKNQKFNDYNKFDNYLSNLGYIPKINQYRVYNKDDYTDYICTDQYNNYYIFRQQGGIMRYTVFLDNYTVELDTFKENYDKAEDNTKLAIQIGKFKQMLNSKDYNAIYSKLNSTFKNNNFSKLSNLENYIKKNAYEQNSIEIGKVEEKNGYYACECTLVNLKNTDEKKNISIIIKLIDFNNFEISFSIN